MIRGRLRSVLVGGVSACVVSLVLAGCGPSPKPDPPRTPDPILTPLYSSDAKALAAAKDAYAKYIAVSNQIGHDGWKDLEPLKTVATGDVLRADTKSANENRKQGLSVSGDITGEVVKLQRIDARSITVYACMDLTATKILGADGSDQTSPDRTDIIPFEITLKSWSRGLITERVDVWSGGNFC